MLRLDVDFGSVIPKKHDRALEVRPCHREEAGALVLLAQGYI